jgi:hypothetical protein
MAAAYNPMVTIYGKSYEAAMGGVEEVYSHSGALIGQRMRYIPIQGL